MAIPNMAMIPSGYKPTKLYSVLPTPSYGSEEVTNGDFATDSDWAKGTTTTISGGQATFTASGVAQPLIQTNLWSANSFNGKTVRLSYTIVSNNLNNKLFRVGGFSSNSAFGVLDLDSTVGTHSVNAVINSTSGDDNAIDFYIQSTATTGALVLENVSLKEVLVSDADFDVSRASSATRVNAQGLIETPEFIVSDELITDTSFDTPSLWVLSANTTIANSKATINSSVGSFQYILTNSGNYFSSTSGLEYKMTYTISENTLVGGGTFLTGGVSGGEAFPLTNAPTTVGVHNLYLVCDNTNATANISLAINGNYTSGSITIDNISIVQVEREDIPRLDYTDGGCPVLLTEPQRTNEVPFSNEFSNVSWNKSSSTIVLNDEISPSGNIDASKLTATSTSQPRLDRGFSVPTVDTKTTFSIFVKKGNTSYIGLSRFSGGQFAIFNLDTKSIVSQNAEDASIKDFGNGWFRISITQTVLSSDSNNIWKVNLTDGSSVTNGVIGEYVYVYGAQLEQASYATSYIPTYGAISTRASETINNSGDVNTFNSEEGVLFFEGKTLVNSGIRVISLKENAASQDRMFLRFDAIGTITFRYLISGAIVVNIVDNTINCLDNNKIACKWELNNFSLWVNGIKVGEDLSGNVITPNTFNKLNLDEYTDTYNFYGKTSQVQVYNTALSDQELKLLTGGEDNYDSYEAMRIALNYNIQ